MKNSKTSPFINITNILLSLLCSIIIYIPTASAAWQQNVNIAGFNNVHIYTPDTNSPVGNGKALLIVLHGCVQPINNYLTANLELAAETYGMVIAVPDAMNKAGYSCWSYWQGAISRTSGDYKNLISLANTMSSDTNRNIDPTQVYIAGLSSGATMSAQTACLAPDVFAGVASSAGPTIGTSSNGALGPCETVSPSTFKSRCEGYAGSFKSHLNTQIAAIGQGTADTTVNTCYNQQNANGFANVYGVSQLAGSNSLSEGSANTASETLWTNNRISMLWFDTLDHSWSGGVGSSGDYISAKSINFASYLGAFFANNNQRVNRNKGPVITNHSAIENSSSLLITGNAIDAEGSVSNVKLTVNAIDSGTPILTETINTTVIPTSGAYSTSTAALNNGLYEVLAIATDNLAKDGDVVTITSRVGPEPPATAPALSGISVSIAGQCATVSGMVIDVNQNLSSVDINFANGTVAATINGNTYSAEQCNLPGGSNIATVTATDATPLTSTDNIQFTIDAGVTGDYNLHINQGHITWGNGYSACYLAFGTSAFTMREYPAGTNQCNWIADGQPSCAGPAQSCTSGSNPDPDSDNDGIIDSLDNCPNVANADQADNDNDGIGNVCDSTPNGTPIDTDNDGVVDSLDNCPSIANADQADNDNDGIGNVCDSTPNGNFACTATTSNNYTHVQAARATTDGAYAYAVGSGTNLGLYNLFITTTLAETSSGYFDLGNCP
jgi:poly(3-hydroxybutyrate) depolymerase